MARASTTGDGTASSADLSKQLETLREDISGLTQIITDMGKQQGTKVAAAASDRARQVQDAGKAAADAATERAELAQMQSADFVRTQPATALGVALGVGFLVGWMSARK